MNNVENAPSVHKKSEEELKKQMDNPYQKEFIDRLKRAYENNCKNQYDKHRKTLFKKIALSLPI